MCNAPETMKSCVKHLFRTRARCSPRSHPHSCARISHIFWRRAPHALFSASVSYCGSSIPATMAAHARISRLSNDAAVAVQSGAVISCLAAAAEERECPRRQQERRRTPPRAFSAWIHAVLGDRDCGHFVLSHSPLSVRGYVPALPAPPVNPVSTFPRALPLVPMPAQSSSTPLMQRRPQ